MSRKLSTLILSIMLAASAPAFAAVTIINTTVIKNAGGFPYTITQPGDYQLDGNVTVPSNTDGIVIAIDHVNLDLNGFSILGPIACTLADSSKGVTCPQNGKGVGIRSGNPIQETVGHRDVKVFNGSVHGMGSYGIFLTGDGSMVEKVTADGNGACGMIVEGLVTASSANANGNCGILAVMVRDSFTRNNAADGIILDGSGGVGTGNTSSFNGGRGMNVPNGAAIGNTITRNGSFGISAKCPAVVTNNSIINNGGGVAIDTSQGSGGCILSNNATLP